MGDIATLRELQRKADRDGIESLTDEERRELVDGLEEFTSSLADAIVPLIEMHADVMRDFVDACEPLLKYSEQEQA